MKIMAVDGCKSDIDFIREQINIELKNILEPQIERIIKCVVKAGVMSCASYLINTLTINKLVDVNKREKFEQVTKEAKAKAVHLFRLKDADMNEYLNGKYDKEDLDLHD